MKSIDDITPKEWDSIFRGAVNDNPPKHYDHTIQPWEYMESILTEEEFQGYLIGNVIKYMSRFKHKGGRTDLNKAKHYLEKLMSVYSGE